MEAIYRCVALRKTEMEMRQPTVHGIKNGDALSNVALLNSLLKLVTVPMTAAELASWAAVAARTLLLGPRDVYGQSFDGDDL